MDKTFKDELFSILQSTILFPDDIKILKKIIEKANTNVNTYSDGNDPFLNHKYFNLLYLKDSSK